MIDEKSKKICLCNKKVYCKGLCKNCYEKRLKKLNPDYHKAQLENSRVWGQKNSDRKKLYEVSRSRRLKETTDWKLEGRKRWLKREYGITLEDYSIMLERQNNTCGLCYRERSSYKPLHVDHDHATGRIRGLLCHQCNWYLGVVEKDANILERIKNWVTK